jgi:anti-anti-sigma factor
VLDFAQCTFVDSTILGVIASATRTLADGGGRLVGLRAEGIVHNALRVTGLDDLLLTDVTAVLDSDVLVLLQEG